jgi:thymidylate synthase (FAD)
MVTMTSQITVEPIRLLAEDSYIAQAARVSVKGADTSAPDDFTGLIRALLRDRHGSPFEHAFFTFRVQAPLFVMTEHLRHRIGWNYNGESGRYKTFEPVFYTPPVERGVTQVGKAIAYDIQGGTAGQRELTTQYLAAHAETAWARYTMLLEAGVAREVARQVLPVNLMTTYYTSCNARSLMHFLGLRGQGTHALWEIQQVAKGYEETFSAAMPVTHQAFADFGRVAP